MITPRSLGAVTPRVCTSRTSRTSRAALAVPLALLVGIALACDDRATSTPRAPGDSAGVPIRETPASATPAAAPLPEPLREACLAGDPASGEAWHLLRPAGTTVGFAPIESLAPRDSARLAARLTRVVDALPSDTARADFRGLPVVVRFAWRLVPADGDTVVVALVARRMPMESSPLEEVFLLVAAPGERPGIRDPLVAQWVAREVGTEEEVVMRELLGATQDAGRLALVLVHEQAEGEVLELLVRRDDGWRVDWSGMLPRCGAP